MTEEAVELEDEEIEEGPVSRKSYFSHSDELKYSSSLGWNCCGGCVLLGVIIGQSIVVSNSWEHGCDQPLAKYMVSLIVLEFLGMIANIAYPLLIARHGRTKTSTAFSIIATVVLALGFGWGLGAIAISGMSRRCKDMHYSLWAFTLGMGVIWLIIGCCCGIVSCVGFFGRKNKDPDAV